MPYNNLKLIKTMEILTQDQIDAVVDWMNNWEQLKGSVIPLRFKEDWTKHLNVTPDFSKSLLIDVLRNEALSISDLISNKINGFDEELRQVKPFSQVELNLESRKLNLLKALNILKKEGLLENP